MSKKIAYAWIRKIDFDGSEHRVGCIVAERINVTNARIAFSLCAPEDKVDLKKAKRLAMRRLKEFKTKSVVISGINKNFHMEWFMALGLRKLMQSHLKKQRVYAHLRNNGALKGLLSEVCPQCM